MEGLHIKSPKVTVYWDQSDTAHNQELSLEDQFEVTDLPKLVACWNRGSNQNDIRQIFHGPNWRLVQDFDMADKQ